MGVFGPSLLIESTDSMMCTDTFDYLLPVKNLYLEMPLPSCSINIALCVIGNKMDLSAQREVSRERGEEFAHRIGAMYTETSAAENTGE